MTKTAVETLEQAEIEAHKAEAERHREEARLAKLRADDLAHAQELRLASEYEHRIYAFDAPVKASSVQACIEEIGLWVRRDPSRPIKVIFNSPGGSVFEGLALFDYLREIRSNGTKVDTLALGMAASMGGILLQAGEKRTMSPHSYLLIHEVSTGAIGNISEIEDELKFSKRLQDRLLGILAERSTLSKQQIARRWKKTDWWLDADEAKEFGFCDEIGN